MVVTMLAPGCYSGVTVAHWGDVPGDVRSRVSLASSVWRIPIIAVDDDAHVDVVWAEGASGWAHGKAWSGAPCSRVLWVDPRGAEGVLLAHELGHVLGLGHVGGAGNVMHAVPGPEVGRRQREAVGDAASWVATWCE